jgi:hypothetical protein
MIHPNILTRLPLLAEGADFFRGVGWWIFEGFRGFALSKRV